MAYKPRITEHAEELLDNLVPQMDYIVVFGIEEDIVNIVGIFHQLENYPQKI